MSIKTSDIEWGTCTAVGGGINICEGSKPWKKKPFDWYFWMLVLCTIIAICFVIWRIITFKRT